MYRLFCAHLRFFLCREKGELAGQVKHFENVLSVSSMTLAVFGETEVLV